MSPRPIFEAHSRTFTHLHGDRLRVEWQEAPDPTRQENVLKLTFGMTTIWVPRERAREFVDLLLRTIPEEEL